MISSPRCSTARSSSRRRRRSEKSSAKHTTPSSCSYRKKLRPCSWLMTTRRSGCAGSTRTRWGWGGGGSGFSGGLIFSPSRFFGLPHRLIFSLVEQTPDSSISACLGTTLFLFSLFFFSLVNYARLPATPRPHTYTRTHTHTPVGPSGGRSWGRSWADGRAAGREETVSTVRKTAVGVIFVR